MDKTGWIKLHRKILDCFIWDDKPYDKARAWIDLLLSAMHKDKKMLVDGKVVIIKQGSFMTSILKLADKWGWNRKTVSAYLKMLENEEMIVTERTSKGTTVTIVNYEKYQVEGSTDYSTERTTDCPTERSTERTQKKNIKNDKNEKKNTLCKTDANALFEELWKLYPVKKGKAQVSSAAKQRLLKVGHDEMIRAIDRYKTELEKDSDWRKPQNGSTFFNSGYVDYLDANYVPGEEKKPIKNKFNSFPQREVSKSEMQDLEKQLLGRKDYIHRIGEYNTDIRNLEKEIEMWKSLGEKVSLQRAEKRLQEKKELRRIALDRIVKALNKISPIEHDVLLMRFIGIDCDGSGELKTMTLQEIAERCKKSYTWVTTVQNRALEHLQKIFDEEGGT